MSNLMILIICGYVQEYKKLINIIPTEYHRILMITAINALNAGGIVSAPRVTRQKPQR